MPACPWGGPLLGAPLRGWSSSRLQVFACDAAKGASGSLCAARPAFIISGSRFGVPLCRPCSHATARCPWCSNACLHTEQMAACWLQEELQLGVGGWATRTLQPAARLEPWRMQVLAGALPCCSAQHLCPALRCEPSKPATTPHAARHQRRAWQLAGASAGIPDGTAAAVCCCLPGAADSAAPRRAQRFRAPVAKFGHIYALHFETVSQEL